MPAREKKPEELPLVLIGASIGGPGTLESVLRSFSRDFPGAILIAQHMPEGKTAELASRLSRQTKTSVVEGEHGLRVKPSHVYLAPGRHNMEVYSSNGRTYLSVQLAPPAQVFVPSIDALFRSGARVTGPRTIAVVLTGIGNDGTEGLREVHQMGGVTLAESEDSSVVFGMPKHAIDSGAVDTVLPKERLGKVIMGTLLSWAAGEG
ncbi:MAG: chemotaxis protein CheB [Candidatus Riflebacteria bacterium]|nr:chemotaxis protein CheB [Candidatus Riflebacteria bacterium]